MKEMTRNAFHYKHYWIYMKNIFFNMTHHTIFAVNMKD